MATPTLSRPRPGRPEVRAALDALRRIVQALRLGRAGSPPAGLGSAQLFALQQIADHPGASVNDIAALTFTHQSSVSVVIQRLVRQRLVARAASRDDRRRQQLIVTNQGRRLLQRAPVAVQEHLIAAILALPAADRRALARALGEVARRMAPSGAGANPPMFFEGGDQDGRGSGAIRTSALRSARSARRAAPARKPPAA